MSDTKMDVASEETRRRTNQKPPDSDRKQSDKQPNPDKPKPLPRWPFLLAGLIVAAFTGVVLWIVFAPQPDVWTDDAYIMVHYATISPRISGQVATVDVADNQVVKAGQVLVTLDPRDYQTAVENAQAALERDKAQVIDAQANVARQPSLITEQEADLGSAQARLSFAQLDQRRYDNLAASGAGTTQQRQQSGTTLQQAQMAVQSAQAALEASRRQLDVLKAQTSSQQGTVRADQAQLDRANLNLSYTRILAPQDGMVGEKTVDVGNNVSPGATLMTVVPLDLVYIEANYREVALRHVRNGQSVTIHVDAYNIDLDGIVDSVPPATGATFSTIPPNNATGNFTKIVQRLPVKILISPSQPLAKLLRVGFSVETTIHTGLEDVVADQTGSTARVTAH